MKRSAFTGLGWLVWGIMCSACSEENESSTVNLGITASADANAGTSYTLSNNVDIYIGYTAVPYGADYSSLHDAITYLNANDDESTDVFMATGKYLLDGEIDCTLALNDGTDEFYSSTAEFDDNMPQATHARKSITSDFNNDALDDVFVFDHGYDANPYPGSNPKLILQNSTGSFTWSKLTDQTGFHHGGAAADIDNDGDMDVFVGGFDPFFYINDGAANFEMVTNRFDDSIDKVFTAELIDVDEDGFVDLIVGAHEQDGEDTSIYWGSSNGSYTKKLRTVLPAYADYGVVLDFDAEDLDGDGDRDIVINRTGSTSLYVGSIIQLAMNQGDRTFTDQTSRIDNPGSDTDTWIRWIRVQDIDDDNDLDIFPDDADYNFMLINDGSGNFTRE